MKYHITTIDGETHAIDLPVNDSITWSDFVNLSQVQALGQSVIDVTPEGMPNRFTDEEMMTRQLNNLGIKRTRNEQGVSEYETVDDSSSDS